MRTVLEIDTDPIHDWETFHDVFAAAFGFPVILASSRRFQGHELRRLERRVVEHRQEFLKVWREFFRT